MAGAIAGTAILKIDGKQDLLNTITLTINNECNMHCSHCYLQYDSIESIIDDNTLDIIFKNKFKHLVIVGKEPLVNNSSIEKLCGIVERCKVKDLTVSFVTNGLNLSSLPPAIIPLIDYIDVSFDGGVLTYEKYRKGNLHKVLDGISFCLTHGLKEVNALHTVCDRTIENISDCVNLKEFVPFSTILFTPYLVTQNHGNNQVSSIPLFEIVRKFDGNSTFNSVDGTMLLIDNYHIEQERICLAELESELDKVKCREKYHVITDDPIMYGIIRVTYDGLVLSPRQSLHPSLYHTAQPVSMQNDLESAFQELRKFEKATRWSLKI